MGSYTPDSKEGSVDEKHPATVDVSPASPDPTHHVEFRKDQVDTGAQLVAGGAVELDPEEATRIRKKIDWHILPLMCSKFHFQPGLQLFSPTFHVSSVLGAVHGQDNPGKRGYSWNSVSIE